MNRLRHPTVFLFACLIAIALQASAATNWQNVAINGGGFVSGILFHPSEPGILYVRTDVGGAYRWDNTNQRWIPLNDDIGGLNNDFMHLGVLSFALDPNDAGRLYLACGQYTWNADWNPNGIILSSTDRGATWVRSTLSIKLGGNEDGRNTGERLQVDPNDGQVLFLGSSQDGLWKSTDHGATWAKVSTFPAASCTFVLFDQTTGSSGSATQTIYVGVNSTTSTSLYWSTNGGSTWSAVPGQPAGLMPHHADIGYAPGGRTLYLAYSNAIGPNGASAGAVWKMDITTGAWTPITPAGGSWGYGGLSVAASDPLTLVVSTIDRWGPHDEIYRSTNGGTTWNGILQSGSLDTSSAPWAAASTPHWTADVKLDPFNSARALFVTGYGLFASDNVAVSTPVWAFRDAGLEETVPAMFVSPPSGPPLVSVVGDVDGFRHSDVNAAPASRHVPMEGSNSSIDFAQTNPSVMARTFYNNAGGAWSNDGGTTWTLFGRMPSATGNGGTIAVSADGARFVWTESAISPNPSIAPYYSTDHGTTWNLSSGTPTGFAPVADRANPAKFYLYDGTHAYVSTDGGVTFSPAASLPGGASPMRAVPGIEGNLWLPAWGSGLLRSVDSGSTFTAVSSVQEAYQVGFGRAAAGQTHPSVFMWGKVAGTVGFFRSDDVGATWMRINDDQHQFGYINWISGDPRIFGRVYLATSGRGVIYGDRVALSDQAFLQQLFLDVLGRPIDSGGAAGFGAALAGGESRATVLGELLGSAEYSAWQVEPVIRLYHAALARMPDYAGLQNWSNALHAGTLTLTGAADQFAASAEFVLKYGSLDNTGYVQQLYRNVLGREADPTGLTDWVGRLNGGASRGTILVGFSESDEFKADMANQVELVRLYYLLERRMPAAAELQYWVGFFNGDGQTSTLFAQGYPAGLADSGYVSLVFQGFLRRPADAGALSTFGSALTAGTVTHGSLVETLLTSTEFNTFVAPVSRLYMAAFRRVPDAGGLDNWVNDVRAGNSLQSAADAFVASQEFQLTYGSLNDTQYVTLLYENVLGREPDPTGLATWTGQLGSGATRGHVLIGFSESQEGIALFAPTVRTFLHYFTFLNATPSPSDLAFWKNYLATLTDQMRITFLDDLGEGS